MSEPSKPSPLPDPTRQPPANCAAEKVLCERCGAVRAVDPAALDEVRAAIRDGFGYEARFTHFPIAGLCPGCRET